MQFFTLLTLFAATLPSGFATPVAAPPAAMGLNQRADLPLTTLPITTAFEAATDRTNRLTELVETYSATTVHGGHEPNLFSEDLYKIINVDLIPLCNTLKSTPAGFAFTVTDAQSIVASLKTFSVAHQKTLVPMIDIRRLLYPDELDEIHVALHSLETEVDAIRRVLKPLIPAEVGAVVDQEYEKLRNAMMNAIHEFLTFMKALSEAS